jgi:putative phage-type endonuclease
MVFLSDLPELEDITDQIIPEGEELTEDEAMEIYDTCIHLMEEYIEHHSYLISDPDFHDIFYDDIEELIFNSFFIDFIDEFEYKLIEIIETAFDDFFEDYMPIRSYDDTYILYEPDYQYVDAQLKYLKNIPQPAQRTKEWYEFRQNLITASNAYKAFENQSVKNQLIYEKCQPSPNCIEVIKYDENGNIISVTSVENQDQSSVKSVNINSTLHWGQKYEPLSVMIYEHKYKTIVDDFGCIQHRKYKFLGASPDGINVDKSSDRYGRMLEIKNIVNREIDGIPKKEYWIQMQLQMEVCDLDECDFLETQFIEYNSYDDYLNDQDCIMKGLVMYFQTKEGKPHYEYRPLTITSEEESQKWEDEIRDKYENTEHTMSWIKNCYWKLEQYSCVLVMRNQIWFEKNIHLLEQLWNTILYERKNGYLHRAPNKRIKNTDENIIKIDTPKCLIVKKEPVKQEPVSNITQLCEKLDLDLVIS